MSRFSMMMTVAAASIAIATPAAASSVAGVMPVSAVTLAACAVVAQPLTFGIVNQIGGVATDTQTTVSVTCTPGVPYEVGMDMGAHPTGGVRHMQAALSSAVIPYTIYTNASRTTAWGSTAGTNTVSGTGALLPTNLTVYGRVAGDAPLVAAGIYSDAVTVTVTF